MNFKKINMDTWNRKNIYNHFINNVRCVMSLTAEVDVTKLVDICKKKDYKFYPTYIYLVSTVINRRDEFKMKYGENGEVLLFDAISPSYTVFNSEDESFTKLATRYTQNFNSFYKQVILDMEKYSNKRGFEIDFSNLNTFDVSCLPWVSYKSLDLHVFDTGTYLSPVITWGKYELQADNTITMPLTMQIHHAVADGFHVARFFSDIKTETEKLIDYLGG